jgi:arsenite methyltransferase
MGAGTSQDVWGSWILERRDGGAGASRSRLFERLAPVRDQILQGTRIGEGGTLMDVGCGDGLVSLGALDLVGPSGKVVFVDISQQNLDFCRQAVEERGQLERAAFRFASADRLDGIDDESVDAITTRAVLIYLPHKHLAFEEFHRALRPGGRISVWEPINAHGEPEPPDTILGFDLGELAPQSTKVREAFDRALPPDRDPMLDFDERDVLSWVEAAGFTDLELRLEVYDEPPRPPADWEAFLDSSPNPLAPTWREAIDEALAENEVEPFLAGFRSLAECGTGRYRRAGAHIIGVKPA